jgi:two-component SAPR family response regulator
MDKLNLDNELLKPMKERLEKSIDVLTKNAILTGKEAKGSYKSSLGFNYSVEIDDENEIVVKNVNEQQSLFGKGR